MGENGEQRSVLKAGQKRPVHFFYCLEILIFHPYLKIPTQLLMTNKTINIAPITMATLRFINEKITVSNPNATNIIAILFLPE